MLPLVIGVTGHKDLRVEDRPDLEARVRELFVQLRASYPATPLLLLSPLAEGADRLVAGVALDYGMRLVVPLPMPRADYENDFATPESRAEFTALLARAATSYALSLAPGSTSDSIREPGEARERQYVQVGAYVARHCHILLALWDGDTADLTGGTAQIVRFKREGIPEPYAPAPSLLSAVDDGLVCHLVTPRARNPHPKLTPFSWQHPDGGTGPIPFSPAWRRVFASVDRLNRDTIRFVLEVEARAGTGRASLLPESNAEALPNALRPLLAGYTVADALALRFRRTRCEVMLWLAFLVVAAVGIFECYHHLAASPLGKAAVLAGYLLAMGMALGLHRWAHWCQCQAKHLDYRALAEGLRVQFFWRLTGLDEQVADRYLRQHRSELDWIRHAIRAWGLPLGVVGPAGWPPAGGLVSLRLALTYWVEDQRDFFAKAAARDHSRLRHGRNLAEGLFGAGLFLTVVLLAGQLWLWRQGQVRHGAEVTLDWLVVLMALCFAVAGAVDWYAEKMALAAQTKQYVQMHGLFSLAATRLREVLDRQDPAGAGQILLELGREALAENGDWVRLHRERPLDLPKAG